MKLAGGQALLQPWQGCTPIQPRQRLRPRRLALRQRVRHRRPALRRPLAQRQLDERGRAAEGAAGALDAGEVARPEPLSTAAAISGGSERSEGAAARVWARVSGIGARDAPWEPAPDCRLAALPRYICGPGLKQQVSTLKVAICNYLR